MIIGICGEMGAGKTTLANFLCSHHNFEVLSFARRFKMAMCVLFNWDESRMHDMAYKQGIDPVTGKVRRVLMQEFATGYIREQIDPIFHTKMVALDTMNLLSRDKYDVVYDDVRHPDEVEFIRAVGGTLIRVIRPNNPHEQSNHKSEKYKLQENSVVTNSGNKTNMLVDIQHVFRDIMFTGTMKCRNEKSLQLLSEYITKWVNND